MHLLFLVVLVAGVVVVVVATPGAQDILGVRWSATPGIPIIETAVKYLQNGRFKRPDRMEKLVIVCRDPLGAGPVAERSLKRISPEEEHHALILATARDGYGQGCQEGHHDSGVGDRLVEPTCDLPCSSESFFDVRI